MPANILSLIKPSNKPIKTSIIKSNGFNIINYTGKNFYFILDEKKYLFLSLVEEENAPQLELEKTTNEFITEVRFKGIKNLPRVIENNIYVVSAEVCLIVGDKRNDLVHCSTYYTDSTGHKEYANLVRFS